VRRIPRRLELVERSGCGWVVRRDLVDDEHLAARPRHPRELGEYALGPRDVMERAVRARKIEVGARESQRFPVPLDEVRVRERASPGELEQLGHGVDADDLPHERRQRERERTGAGADVQRSFVAARPDEVAHLLRQPGSAVVLVCGEALGRTCETLS
jgi:hypothetical protein